MNNHEFRAYKNVINREIFLLEEKVQKLRADLATERSYMVCDHKDHPDAFGRNTVEMDNDGPHCLQCDRRPTPRTVEPTVCTCGERPIKMGHKKCAQCLLKA